MKRLFVNCLAWAAMVFAPTLANAQEVIHLWPNGAPTNNEFTEPMSDDGEHASRVIDPTLTIFRPEHPNGICVVSCPGGAYWDVWYVHEGSSLAEWYKCQGITYCVLKYRLPNHHPSVPLEDVHETMRYLRSHADDLHINKIGVQGFSAGGHLASTAATHYGNAVERPDFQILFYPVVTMDPAFTHMGSHDNLLGEKPSKELEELYSNEKQVTDDTPPAFILHSSDDDCVPLRNSLAYCQALNDHHVSVTFHVYPVGGHGWGFRDNFPYKYQWTGELEKWLREVVLKY